MTPEKAIQDGRPDMLPADRLAEALGAVDLYLSAAQSVNDHLVVVRKSLSRHILKNGMGHTTFKSSPIGDIPAAWQVKSLGEIASLTSGKTKPKDSSYVRSRSHSVPIYGGNGLLGFSSSALHRGSTIIVGRVGAHCGAVHFVSDEESWITDSALFVYETRPEVDLRFLYHSLCRLDLPSLRNIGRQPLISLSAIYPVLLALPPLSEQQGICEVLRSLETLMTAEDRVLGQTRRIRSALLEGFRAGGMGRRGMALDQCPQADISKQTGV